MSTLQGRWSGTNISVAPPGIGYDAVYMFWTDIADNTTGSVDVHYTPWTTNPPAWTSIIDAKHPAHRTGNLITMDYGPYTEKLIWNENRLEGEVRQSNELRSNISLTK